MTMTTAPDARPLRVLPIPDCSPPVIEPQGTDAPVWAEPRADTYRQDMLAVDFRAAEDEALFGPQHTPSRDLPDPLTWAAHIAQALVEVMSGTRPAPQVIRWTAPEVYSTVARRAAVSARRGVAPGRRAVVRRVRVCEPVDGVVEACAVVVDRGRVRALAMRLTGLDRRWLVTELQVG